MKNIQDIMNEMSNLSEQIAVTLNNEEIVDGEIVDVEMSGDPTPSNNLTTPPCVTNSSNTPACADPQSRVVPFCCTVGLPGTFLPADISPVIIYDLSCLKAIIEPCCCNGTQKFDIRIVGCIPFIVNIAIRNTPGNGGNCVVPFRNAAGQLNVVSACCSNSVCVNNVICNRCTYEDAVITRANLRFNCDTVIASLNALIRDNCAAIVTGKFTLPTCP